MDHMKEKIEILMGGETEANKLIDSIVPTLTSIENQVGNHAHPHLHKESGGIVVPTLTSIENQV